ncbi:hypothetical protein F5051DRAFT_75467 [Lentinula edodes]|nr:hypothetical protein F5051DRAFT_75467 [Lentinula edodes]
MSALLVLNLTWIINILLCLRSVLPTSPANQTNFYLFERPDALYCSLNRVTIRRPQIKRDTGELVDFENYLTDSVN